MNLDNYGDPMKGYDYCCVALVVNSKSFYHVHATQTEFDKYSWIEWHVQSERGCQYPDVGYNDCAGERILTLWTGTE